MIRNSHLVIPDPHSIPGHSNERAEGIGKLIADLKPEVVINMGDGADMESLSSYDKGLGSFHGRSYEKDIDAFLDFEDRLWEPMRRQKKKRPRRIFLEGNHEHRIKKAMDQMPEYTGHRYGISFRDLDLDHYYDDVVEYEGGTPGIVTVDGVSYAHYFIAGVSGRPVSGEHQAYALITKNFTSCTQGHTHTVDWSVRTDTFGRKIMGLVCGVGIDYNSSWAGHSNDLWWRGVVFKRHVEDGVYDPQFISMESLKKEYG